METFPSFARELVLVLVVLHGVASTDSLAHYAAHPGQRYGNIALATRERTLGLCGRKCAKRKPPCYAFNYRETDGSCQLVLDGKSGLLEGNDYSSYVQRLCLTEHPKIPSAKVSYEEWNGEYPAPPGAMVILRCEHPRGFSDGSSIHTARCSASPDSWCSSFQENAVQCKGFKREMHKYPECRLTKKGREYIGTTKATESGKECLPWSSHPYGTPKDFLNQDAYDSNFINLDSWSHKNYCRNPSWRERPWCFVSDHEVQWEYCDIPMCTDTNPPECKAAQQGGEYIGRKRVTHAGVPCQRWEKPKLREKLDCCRPGFPDEPIAEDHDYCRNPNGDAAPWCYNEDGDREFCDVPFCAVRSGQGILRIKKGDGDYPECRLTEKGKEYFGMKNETETGRPCLPWESQSHRMPWDFFNNQTTFGDHFLNHDLSFHMNYCRNPALYRERPWCFVSDQTIEWEYCDVPFCRDPNPPECKLTGKGGEYVGRRNVTISGFPCVYWLSSTAAEIVSFFLSSFSDEIDGSHNFCRSIKPGTHGPMCLLSLPTGPRAEYCDIPFCPASDGKTCDVRVSGNCISERWFSVFLFDLSVGSPSECQASKTGVEYIGTKNTTKSGYPCQPWMSNTPNSQEFKSHYGSTFKNHFPDDLHPSHNFCRNPTSDPKGPWCYNGAGKKPPTDNCDIPSC
ncbi:unnamed protein product [Darwinula stevensoni]|uniref:Kringle domain-containing protein n=1 Tax=Darwinula stevensoni TaxID=69355 RepID=A0A7R9AAN1_9CRUS|nr:unnamed protein product [Darwinula stevensoni]CAG0898308.1 unnamed protein product [Darwinula stevensoni]